MQTPADSGNWAQKMWWLLAIYGLIVLRWLGGHVDFSRAMRTRRLARVAPDDRADASPRVSVIVAAHNEADGLAACLKRILAQDYANLEVILANDRSTDATGAIAREIAAANPNVRVVDIESLPSGWMGKAHASAVAAEQAAGELLVFTDADVLWRPELLGAVVARMQRERLDFLSLWPTVVLVTFWERVLLPACGWLLSLWFPLKTRDDADVGPPFANGQFIAIRKTTYEASGGFGAVRDELTEDVAMASRVRKVGGRMRLGLAGDYLTTRMYENLSQILAGWTRIFCGALSPRWKTLASIPGIAMAAWTPFVVLLVLLVSWRAEAWTAIHSAWLACAVVHLTSMYGLLYRQFGVTTSGRPVLASFPMALVGVIWLLIRSFCVSSGIGAISWGGVRYKVRGSRVNWNGGTPHTAPSSEVQRPTDSSSTNSA